MFADGCLHQSLVGPVGWRVHRGGDRPARWLAGMAKPRVAVAVAARTDAYRNPRELAVFPASSAKSATIGCVDAKEYFSDRAGHDADRFSLCWVSAPRFRREQ